MSLDPVAINVVDLNRTEFKKRGIRLPRRTLTSRNSLRQRRIRRRFSVTDDDEMRSETKRQKRQKQKEGWVVVAFRLKSLNQSLKSEGATQARPFLLEL